MIQIHIRITIKIVNMSHLKFKLNSKDFWVQLHPHKLPFFYSFSMEAASRNHSFLIVFLHTYNMIDYWLITDKILRGKYNEEKHNISFSKIFNIKLAFSLHCLAKCFKKSFENLTVYIHPCVYATALQYIPPSFPLCLPLLPAFPKPFKSMREP